MRQVWVECVVGVLVVHCFVVIVVVVVGLKGDVCGRCKST